MAEWHGYVGFENLALDVGRRNALHQALTALGPGTDPQPARILHWVTRPDNEAGIYEAAFDKQNVNLAGWKARLATLFGVDPATVDYEAQMVSFGPGQTRVWTLSRNGTDYLRVALFGSAWVGWEDSRQETLGYLALHRDEWEEEELLLAEAGIAGRALAVARDVPKRAVWWARREVGSLLMRFGDWVARAGSALVGGR